MLWAILRESYNESTKALLDVAARINSDSPGMHTDLLLMPVVHGNLAVNVKSRGVVLVVQRTSAQKNWRQQMSSLMNREACGCMACYRYEGLVSLVSLYIRSFLRRHEPGSCRLTSRCCVQHVQSRFLPCHSAMLHWTAAALQALPGTSFDSCALSMCPTGAVL